MTYFNHFSRIIDAVLGENKSIVGVNTLFSLPTYFDWLISIRPLNVTPAKSATNFFSLLLYEHHMHIAHASEHAALGHVLD